MDFTNRSQPAPAARPAVSPEHDAGHSHRRHKTFVFFKLFTALLLFSGTVLLVAVVLSLAFYKGKPEGRLVNNKAWQVVVLGQNQTPYFGHIQEVNDRYIRLTNIYYFQATQTVQPDTNKNSQQNLSLVKLGCEIHGPQDQMVIRRDEVLYWENLKDSGQVAKAISAYQQQNPNGQQCTTSTNSSTTTPPATTTPKKP